MPTLTKPQTKTLVELLSHLVQFPTISNDHATNRAAIDWVEQQLEGLPLHIERHESRGFPSLTATTQPTKNPKLWLVAHMDVVPGTVDNFKPIVRDGRLYGRGTHDMKFAIAVFIALLQDINITEFDLGLMVTSDEEVGGHDGVGWLLEQGYRGQAALIPDCNANWKREVAAKGVSWWNITATGRTAHASRTWAGVNAIDELVRFVELVRANVPKEPCPNPLHQHSTLNLSTITGGNATNTVPSSASASIDIRFPPDVSLEEVAEWFKAAEAAVPSVHATNVVADPPYHAPDSELITRFANIVQDVTGHKLGQMLAHGSSDARHFVPYRTPTINVAPTGSGYHVPDEWVDIEDLGRFYEVTRRFVEDCART